MASAVDIANRALQKLGAKRIVELDEDSKNARSCNICYQPLLDAELRAHTWNFAITRASLAADATAPIFGRAAAYQLPSDFLRLLKPYPEDNSNALDWQIEGKKIYSDQTAPLLIRYIRTVSDPNDMDSIFRELLATSMAIEMCEEITQSNTKKAGLKDDYKYIVAQARRANALENVPAVATDGTWVTERA